VDLLHCCTGLFHRGQSLVIDVRRFNGVYLLLELHDLRRCLLEVLLMDLFPSEGILGG
jgi:hypothetical protein